MEEQLFLSEEALVERLKRHGKARCHWAEELRRGSPVYSQLIGELHKRGMIDFAWEVRDFAGLFAVKKKDGESAKDYEARVLAEVKKMRPPLQRR